MIKKNTLGNKLLSCGARFLVLYSLLISFCLYAYGWIEIPGNFETDKDPLIIAFQNRLYLFAVSYADARIYFNVYNGVEWSGWAMLRDQSGLDSGPTNNMAATVRLSVPDLLLYQETSDGRLRVLQHDGAAWWNWLDFPSSPDSSGPAAAWFGNTIHIFRRHAVDNSIQYVRDLVWRPINPTTDQALPRLSAVAFNNDLYVLYRGLNDMIFFTRSANGLSWSGSMAINPGADWTGAGPAAVVFNSRLHVVYRGLDSRIYVTSSADGNGWDRSSEVFPGGGWTDVAPTATVYNDQLYVVTKGHGSNRRLYINRPLAASCSPPAITRMNPTYGSRGETIPVEINGLNLAGATLSSSCRIQFENVTVSATQIHADFNLTGASPGACTISVSTGCPPAATRTFTVGPQCTPPAIASMTSSRGYRGQTIPVTIFGQGLANARLSSTCGISFRNVSSVSSVLSADFDLTQAAAGPCAISVATFCPPATATSFTVDLPCAPPSITNLIPNRGVRGQALADVQINGSNLQGVGLSSSCGVAFENVRVTPNQILADFNLASATEGACTVGASTSCGSASVPFTVDSCAPLVTEISPSRGARGTIIPIQINGSSLQGGSLVDVSECGLGFENATTDPNWIRADFNLRNANEGNCLINVRTVCGLAPTPVAFQVGPPRPPCPTGPPTITRVTPGLIRNEQITDITIQGANLCGSTLRVPTDRFDPRDPPRYFPTATILSINPDGTEMTVRIDATDDRIYDTYALILSNDRGSKDTHIRILPQARAIWDVQTPRCPRRGLPADPGRAYILEIAGFNLEGATIRPEHPDRLAISDLDTNDTNISGVLEVLPGAPRGETFLILDNPRVPCTPEYYDYCRIPIFILLPTEPGCPNDADNSAPAGGRWGQEDFSSNEEDLLEENLTEGLKDQGIPPLYFARNGFAIRQGYYGEADGDVAEVTSQEASGPEASGAGLAGVVDRICVLVPLRRLFSRNFQRTFTFCRGSGTFSDACLSGLGVGQVASIAAFTLSLFFEVDLSVKWLGNSFCFPRSYPVLCVRAVAGAEVPGCCGAWASVDACLGRPEDFSSLARGRGRTSRLDFQSAAEGCYEVADQWWENPDPERRVVKNADIRLLHCCEEPLRATAAGRTFDNSRFGRDFLTQHVGCQGFFIACRVRPRCQEKIHVSFQTIQDATGSPAIAAADRTAAKNDAQMRWTQRACPGKIDEIVVTQDQEIATAPQLYDLNLNLTSPATICTGGEVPQLLALGGDNIRVFFVRRFIDEATLMPLPILYGLADCGTVSGQYGNWAIIQTSTGTVPCGNRTLAHELAHDVVAEADSANPNSLLAQCAITTHMDRLSQAQCNRALGHPRVFP